MSEEETKSAKIPMFSGHQKDWDVWETKFKTALGGKGYSYLTIPGADPIPVDTEDLSDRTDDNGEPWRGDSGR